MLMLLPFNGGNVLRGIKWVVVVAWLVVLVLGGMY